MQMYAVAGVGGYVGGQTAARLLELVPADQIIVTSRNEAVLAAWRAKGVQARKADYGDRAAFAAALQGAKALFMVSAMQVGAVRQAQHRNAIEAAKAAGVERIVYTSFLGAGDPSINSFEIADHRYTEQLILASGMSWNFMRNSQYGDAMAENQAAIAISSGRSIGNTGDGRVAFISRDDVAAVAAALLAGKGERNHAYDVTGPESVSWRDVAAMVAEISGASIEVVDLTDEQMYAMWDSLGVPREATGDFSRSPVPWCSDGMVSLGREIRLGHLATVTNVVEQLTGHKPKSLRALMKEKSSSWPKVSARV
jgi:NAD(P)H dehydrogenase (quinone)